MTLLDVRVRQQKTIHQRHKDIPRTPRYISDTLHHTAPPHSATLFPHSPLASLPSFSPERLGVELGGPRIVLGICSACASHTLTHPKRWKDELPANATLVRKKPGIPLHVKGRCT